MTRALVALVLCGSCVLARAADKSSAAAPAMTILRANCLSCHNDEKHKGGLRLTTREQALKGGEDGFVLVPGKPDDSLLAKLILPEADPHMPPKKQLADKDIATIRKWIASGMKWDAKVLAENPADARPVRLGAMPASYQPVLALALSPNEKQLAVGRANHVDIHDLTQTNRPVVARLEGHRDAVQSLAWSPEGQCLAAGGFRRVLLWDTQTLEQRYDLTNNLVGRVTALAFTPDGATLAASDGVPGRSGVIHLFSVTDGKNKTHWPAHGYSIYALRVSPDGKLLATAGADKLVKLWEVETMKETAKLEAHLGHVFALAFNHDGSMLASAGTDKTLNIWDTKTRKQEIVLNKQPAPVTALAWTPDGKSLFAVCDDGSLRAFTEFKTHSGAESSQGAQDRTLAKAGEVLYSLTVSADGRNVFAGGHDGFVHTWGADGKLRGKLSFETAQLLTSAGSSGSQGTRLPLTPALSPREREKRSQSARNPEALSPREARATIPPLPGGEGRGEGKQTVRNSADSVIHPVVLPDKRTLSFINDVLPVLSKAGCNAGSCHAKADGQNGFKLSVFAYDPQSDCKHIVKADRGRRVFPAAPEQSLILLKPTLGLDHEGGQRFEVGSGFYKTILVWLQQGMPFGRTNEPMLAGIKVFPPERRYRKGDTQKLRVEARYSDGSFKDVTHLAEFVSNDKSMATVDERGVVKAGHDSGEGVVVVRYMGQVGTSRIAVPPDKKLPDSRYAALPVDNEIDRLVYARLKSLGLLPSAGCSDSEFLRRASLDAIGTLPTPEQAREFLADTSTDKRSRLIDHLLDHPAYADHWAVKWGDLIRPNPSRVGVKPVYLLDLWLRDAFRQNKPYDQFVRELITAQGSTHQYGPAALFRDKRDPADASAFTSQIFLGVRMECAKCHHHPNEKWSQIDYYQLAAYFGQVKRKGQGISAPISGEAEFIWHGPGGEVKHPVTGEVMKPKAPDGPLAEIDGGRDPRVALAEWMTSTNNPFFARAIVNRVWAQFMGRGIVDPVDDFRASNPPTNEPLLDWLARDFAGHGYDLKQLMRTIMRSRIYQFSSLPDEHAVPDTKNFSRAYRRRLPAEVLLDAVCDVTGVPEKFDGLPPGARALETWNHKIESEFMDAFGRPNSSAECPCDRDAKPSVVQVLHLMNSNRLQGKIASGEGRARKLAESKLSDPEIIAEVYLAAYSRLPTPAETGLALRAFSEKDATRKSAVEDVMWALLNSAEFVFNH